MLNSINRFFETYQRWGPHSHLLQSIQRISRHEVKDPHTWEVVKEATKNIDVCGELFDISFDRPTRYRGLIPVKYFRNVDVALFVYDQFIGAWDQFPHHDLAIIYFSKHIYAKFVLHMRPDCIDTRSRYYGPNIGHTYDRKGLIGTLVMYHHL